MRSVRFHLALLCLSATVVSAESRLLLKLEEPNGAPALAWSESGGLLAACGSFADGICWTQRLDQDLSPVAEPSPIDLSSFSAEPWLAMFPEGDVFLLTALRGTRSLSMIPLDADGLPSGPEAVFPPSPDLALFRTSVVTYRDGIVAAAHGDFFNLGLAYAWGAAATPDGQLTREWRPLARKRVDRESDHLALFSDTLIQAIHATDQGFVVAWVDQLVGTGNGVMVVDLDARGRPWAEAQVEPESSASTSAFALPVGRRQAIVYAVRRPEREIRIASRNAGDRYVNPGIRVDFPDGVPLLQAVSNGSTVGILSHELVGQKFFFRFWEIDLAGNVLRGPVEIPEAFYRASSYPDFLPPSFRLVGDAQRGYLLLWSGDGPQGPGAYLREL